MSEPTEGAPWADGDRSWGDADLTWTDGEGRWGDDALESGAAPDPEDVPAPSSE